MFGLSGAFGGNKKAMRRAQGPLKAFYDVPQPDPKTPLSELKLLAVDVETTGLDSRKDKLLSIGWVPINGTTIDLSGAGHVVLKGVESVGQSATIHRLTDDALSAGLEPQDAVAAVLEQLQGRAMLVHYAAMEQGFLGEACKTYFGADLHVQTVDTMTIERRHMEKMGTYPRGEDLRLPRVRRRYGLPYYMSHNALIDALACAELYLALVANSNGTTLKAMQP